MPVLKLTEKVEMNRCLDGEEKTKVDAKICKSNCYRK